MLWGIYSAIYGEVNVSVEKCVEINGDYVEKQQSCFVTLKSWSGRKLLDRTTYIDSYISVFRNSRKDSNINMSEEISVARLVSKLTERSGRNLLCLRNT